MQDENKEEVLAAQYGHVLKDAWLKQLARVSEDGAVPSPNLRGVMELSFFAGMSEMFRLLIKSPTRLCPAHRIEYMQNIQKELAEYWEPPNYKGPLQ